MKITCNNAGGSQNPEKQPALVAWQGTYGNKVISLEIEGKINL